MAELSARNQLRGTVTAVRVEGLMAEVTIDVGGQTVVSIITADSARRLNLQASHEVLAVIKATEVMVARP